MSRLPLWLSIMAAFLWPWLSLSCLPSGDDSRNDSLSGGEADLSAGEIISPGGTEDFFAQNDAAPDPSVQGDDQTKARLTIKLAAGGAPGNHRSKLVIDPNGGKYVLSTRSRELVLYTEQSANNWSEEFIYHNAFYPSLALDPSGKLHVAFMGLSRKQNALIYGTNASGNWRFQIVDRSGNVGAYASIAVDATGQPHIAYFDETLLRLKYATLVLGLWKTEVVDWSWNTGRNASLAIDGNGFAHICYHDHVQAAIRYANNTTLSWQTEIVEPTATLYGDTSIAVEPSGVAHLAYLHNEDYNDGTDVHYATNRDGSWNIQSLAESTQDTIGFYNSIALDDQGYAYVGFSTEDDVNSPTVFSADVYTNRYGEWTRIFNTADGGAFPFSLAVDGQSTAHLIYSTSFGLNHWHGDGGTSTDAILKHVVSGIGFISMALDENDVAHFAFTGAEPEQFGLYYTNESAGPGTAWLLDAGWDNSYPNHEEWVSPGWNSSIAVAADGGVHISYQWHYHFYEINKAEPPAPDIETTHNEYQLRYIKVAEDESGMGSSPIILDTAGCGETALALDPAGHPNIVYLQWPTSYGAAESKGDGLYLRAEASEWEMETVAENADIEHALVMDDEGYLHVAYADYLGYGTYGIYYANNRSGAWQAELVDQIELRSSGLDLTLDAAGHAHLAYYDLLSGGLKYATHATGNWETTVVDDTDHCGASPSILVDGEGHCYIAYWEYGIYRLKFATNISGEWVSFWPDPNVPLENPRIQLSLDHQYNLRLAYMADGAVWIAKYPLYFLKSLRGN